MLPRGIAGGEYWSSKGASEGQILHGGEERPPVRSEVRSVGVGGGDVGEDYQIPVGTAVQVIADAVLPLPHRLRGPLRDSILMAVGPSDQAHLVVGLGRRGDRHVLPPLRPPYVHETPRVGLVEHLDWHCRNDRPVSVDVQDEGVDGGGTSDGVGEGEEQRRTRR